MKYQDAEKRDKIGEHKRNDRRLLPVCFENVAGKFHDLRSSALFISATSQLASATLAMLLPTVTPDGLVASRNRDDDFFDAGDIGVLKCFLRFSSSAEYFSSPPRLNKFNVGKNLRAALHSGFRRESRDIAGGKLSRAAENQPAICHANIGRINRDAAGFEPQAESASKQKNSNNPKTIGKKIGACKMKRADGDADENKHEPASSNIAGRDFVRRGNKIPGRPGRRKFLFLIFRRAGFLQSALAARRSGRNQLHRLLSFPRRRVRDFENRHFKNRVKIRPAHFCFCFQPPENGFIAARVSFGLVSGQFEVNRDSSVARFRFRQICMA